MKGEAPGLASKKRPLKGNSEIVSISIFTITAESSRVHWLIFIVNKRTDMKFIIYATLTQQARAENLKSRSVTF